VIFDRLRDHSSGTRTRMIYCTHYRYRIRALVPCPTPPVLYFTSSFGATATASPSPDVVLCVYFFACESLGAGQKQKFNVMMGRCHSCDSYYATSTGRILDPGHLRARRVGLPRIFRGSIYYRYDIMIQIGRGGKGRRG